MQSVSETLELLVDLFQFDKARAEALAQKLKPEEVQTRFDQLDALVGSDNACKILVEGELLTYENGHVRDYFALAQQARDVMTASIAVPAFYSIPSLKEFLGVKEQLKLPDFTTVNVAEYRIFRPDEKSRRYLNALADKGWLEVEAYERWNTTGANSGPQATSILKVITQQLTKLFDELDLDHPRSRLSHDDLRLNLHKDAQESLQHIRDYVLKNK
jgi:hypothetical protein